MKRDRKDLTSSIALYIYKNEKSLLNEKQKELLKPYEWRFKVASKSGIFLEILYKVNKKLGTFFYNLFDSLKHHTEDLEEYIEKKLVTDPRIIRSVKEEMISKIESAEDENGQERFDEYRKKAIEDRKEILKS